MRALKSTAALLSLFSSLSLFVSFGPVLGELIATSPPLRFSYSLPGNINLKYERVSFTTSDGLILRGWFFPTTDVKAPAVIYTPATAKDQFQGLSLVEPLHRAGFQVLLFSYRGSGESEGNRFSFSYGARESLDVDAAVRFLSQERGISKIAGIGHSAGAVSLILSAARNPDLDALVLAAPFATLDAAWQENRPVFFPSTLYQWVFEQVERFKGFSRDEVRPVDVVHRIAPRSVLFIFGSADRRIGTNQARQLFLAAGEPKQAIWLPEANHNQVRFPGLDSLMPSIVEFLMLSLRDS